jgi:prepilin-type N-terminal cleavage/methylation domain-containing protein
MKTLSAKAKISGFTLIELLVVICVIVVLAVLFLPTHTRSKSGRGIQCVWNQKEIAVGFMLFADDNAGKFPWQLSTTNGGTMELIDDGHPSSQFQALSVGYVRSLGTFICSSDVNRQPATNYTAFSDLNTSYFVSVDATTNNVSSILTGDRNLLANGQPVKPGLFTFTNNTVMGWTRELHGKHGNYPIGFMSFADGHVQGEWDEDSNLTSRFQKQGLVSDRLTVP